LRTQRSIREDKPNPRAGEPEELAERAQHDQSRTRTKWCEAVLRRDIHERLIDDQPAAARGQLGVPVQ